MNKVLWKDNLSEIKKSWPRFLSILLIMLLGVAFFVGIRATSPSMIETTRQFYERYDLPNGQVLSTLGLEETDVEMLRAQGLVVNPLKAFDTTLSPLNVRVKVYPYTNQDYFFAVEGELPTKAGEIALDMRYRNGEYKIGDEVMLESSVNTEAIEGMQAPYLRQTSFRITGFVDSSLYFSKISRGVTNVNGIVLVNEQDVLGDLYTEILYWVPQAKNKRAYSSEYNEIMEEVSNQLEQLFSDRPDIRLSALKSKLQDKIEKGATEIQDGYAELKSAEEKLADAQRELMNGRYQYAQGLKELIAGKQQYQEGEAKIADGEFAYQEGLNELESKTEVLNLAEQSYQEALSKAQTGQATFDTEILTAEKKLSDANTHLKEAQSKLELSKTELDTGLTALLSGETSLKENKDSLLAGLKANIPNLEVNLTALKAQAETDQLDVQTKEEVLANLSNEPELTLIYLRQQLSRLTTTKVDLEAKITAAPEQLDAVNSGLTEIETGLQTLSENLLPIETAETELNTTITTINESVAQTVQLETTLVSQVDQLSTQITDTQNQLAQLLSDDPNYTVVEAQLTSLQGALTQAESDLANAIQTKVALEQNLTALNEQLSILHTQKEALITQQNELQTKQTELLTQKTGLEQLLSDETQAQLDQLVVSETTLSTQISTLETAISELATAETQLSQSKAQLEAGQKAYDEGLAAYQQGLADYQVGESELATKRVSAQQELDNGWTALNTAREQLDEGWAQRQNGLDALLTASTELEQGRTELQEAQQEIQEGETELADALQKLNDGQSEYFENLEKFKQEKYKAQNELSAGEVKLSDVRRDLEKLEAPTYFINLRDSFDSYDNLYDNANQIYQISTIFPLFFFGIAVLVTFTTIKRMASEQRNYMGTMKQMGYSNGAILSKFVFYAVLATLIGTVIGIEIGYRIFPSVIMNAYNNLFHFDQPVIVRSHQLNLFVTMIALLCALVPSIWTPLRILRAKPAQLLQPEAPKAGKKIMLERIPFIWQRLSFNRKMTIRNLLRYKGRNLMTLLGVAGCTMLIVTGFGISDTIADLVDTQFRQLQTYDAMVYLSEEVSENRTTEIEMEISNTSGVNEQIPLHLDTWQTKSDMAVQSVSIVVPLSDYHDFINIHERQTPEKKLDLPSIEGVVISERLAEYVNVQVGESLILTKDGHEVSLPIQAITENYIGHYVYLSPQNYEKYFVESPTVNSLFVKFASDTNHAEIEERITNIEDVATIVNLYGLEAKVQETMGSLNVITIVLVVSAAALAFVVLYNLTNINVSERLRELSTIKVLGFYNHEVSLYIYDEILILTVIGTAIGLGLGVLLNVYILKTIQMPNLFFYPQVKWPSHVLSAVMTFIFSSVVMLVMHQKLKRIDMVEALKAVE